jgi:hypothetical protein
LKIINTDSKPYEWTFNGCTYGPLAPGQIGEFPDEVAIHAVKRGVVLDETGDFVRYRCEFLDSVSREKVKEIAQYECPYKLTNECNAAAFKNEKELQAHMKSHWELSEELTASAAQAKPAAPAQQSIRK